MDTAVRKLVDRFPVGCGTTDATGRVLWMNKSGAALVGASPRKVVGKPIQSFWPCAPAAMPKVPETRLEYAVIGGRGVWLRITRLPHDGTWLAVAEDATAEVEIGALRTLSWIASRSGKVSPTPDALTLAVANAFGRKRSPDAMVEAGLTPGKLGIAAIRLLL